MCGICGDDKAESRGRWWSPDDGWRWAALCDSCHADFFTVKPKESDYAWDKRGVLDVDTAIVDTDGMI